jgi:uncharacterized protein with NAD-binding domain and iron-sulfur cluster
LTSKSREELARHLLGDVRRVYPALGAREPDRTLVVTEWRATYSARPGLEANRPGPRTGVPGLYLAGDLCDVGWPPTMEGAVRAGRAAAAAVGDDANLERGGAAAYPRAAHG